MIKKILFGKYFFPVAFALFVSIAVSAQEFEWAQKAGYYAFDYGYGVCADGAGNVYVAGKYEMNASFGDSTVACEGNHDIFTAKYSTAGDLQWVKTAGGEWGDYAHAITCDAAGNLYVTGEIEMTATFGGTNASLSSWGSNDMFLAKYDSQGNLIWAKRGGGRESDQGLAVAIFGDAVYVAGKFKDTAYFESGKVISIGNDDIYIAKYDINGNFIWVKRAGGSEEDEALGITVDATGFVYITGYFHGNAEFGGKITTSYGDKDMFVAKYDPAGKLIWIKQAGGKYNDRGSAVKAGKDGNIYLTGAFRQQSRWDNIYLTALLGDTDIFTACYTSDGNAVWVKKAGGDVNDRGMGIDIDASSNVYVTGYFGVTSMFEHQKVTAPDSADIFVAKYDKNGTFLWVMQGTGNKDHTFESGTEEAGRALWVDNAGNVLVAGSYRSDAIFGSTTLQGWMHTDIFIAKIKSAHQITDVKFHQNLEKGLIIYPNPSNGNFQLTFSEPGTTNLAIQVQTLEGQAVFEKSFKNNGQFNETIDLATYASGIYLLKVFTGEEIFVKKLIKN